MQNQLAQLLVLSLCFMSNMKKPNCAFDKGFHITNRTIENGKSRLRKI